MKGKLAWYELVLLFGVFFPWVSFRLNDLDTQPWPFLASLVFLVFQRKFPVNREIMSVMIFSIACLLVYVFGFIVDSAQAMRAVVGFASISIVAYAFYLLKISGKDYTGLLLLINVIWLLAGFIQVVFGIHALDFLVVVRTSETRGVTGLSPEPTFYAIFLLVISWIVYQEVYLEKDRGDWGRKLSVGIIAANVLFIFFVAKSSMGVAYLAIMLLFILLFLLADRGLVGLLVGVAAYFLVPLFYIYVAPALLDGTRLYALLNGLIESPLTVVELDKSVNERLSHIYYSFYGFYDSFFLPNGIGVFSEYAQFGVGEYRWLFWSMPGDKIMSWLGAMLFELGVLGFLFYLSILSCFGVRRRFSVFFLNSSIFTILALSAVPHGFAPMSALIGLCAAWRRGRD